MSEHNIKLNNLVEEQKEKENKNLNAILPLLPFDSNKKYSYFVIHNWMSRELNLSGNTLMIFAIIFGFNNSTGKVCIAGRKYLAELINATEVTVSKCIKELENANLIIVDRIQDNEKTYNYYMINAETLFNKISDTQITISNYDNVNGKMDKVELDKLLLLAEKLKEYNENKNKENNNINTPILNVNDSNKDSLCPPLNNFTTPIKNLNTNNIINNIDDNIVETKDNINIIFSSANAHSETSTTTISNITVKENNDIVSNDCINDKTNLNNIDSISEIDSENNALLNDLSNIQNDKQETKSKKKKEFVLNTKGDKPKPKRNTKSNRAKETAKMFVLIKQLFENDEVNEPDLVEILTQYLQSRLGMKEAKALTYEVWQSQLELLIKICEGDYKYAKDVATQAYLGQYRVLCFPNQQKSNKTYNGYNVNRKYGYEIETNEEVFKLNNAERKERKQVLNTRIAKNDDGNNFKF